MSEGAAAVLNVMASECGVAFAFSSSFVPLFFSSLVPFTPIVCGNIIATYDLFSSCKKISLFFSFFFLSFSLSSFFSFSLSLSLSLALFLFLSFPLLCISPYLSPDLSPLTSHPILSKGRRAAEVRKRAWLSLHVPLSDQREDGASHHANGRGQECSLRHKVAERDNGEEEAEEGRRRER